MLTRRLVQCTMYIDQSSWNFDIGCNLYCDQTCIASVCTGEMDRLYGRYLYFSMNRPGIWPVLFFRWKMTKISCRSGDKQGWLPYKLIFACKLINLCGRFFQRIDLIDLFNVLFFRLKFITLGIKMHINIFLRSILFDSNLSK